MNNNTSKTMQEFIKYLDSGKAPEGAMQDLALTYTWYINHFGYSKNED